MGGQTCSYGCRGLDRLPDRVCTIVTDFCEESDLAPSAQSLINMQWGGSDPTYREETIDLAATWGPFVVHPEARMGGTVLKSILPQEDIEVAPDWPARVPPEAQYARPWIGAKNRVHTQPSFEVPLLAGEREDTKVSSESGAEDKRGYWAAPLPMPLDVKGNSVSTIDTLPSSPMASTCVSLSPCAKIVQNIGPPSSSREVAGYLTLGSKVGSDLMRSWVKPAPFEGKHDPDNSPPPSEGSVGAEEQASIMPDRHAVRSAAPDYFSSGAKGRLPRQVLFDEESVTTPTRKKPSESDLMNQLSGFNDSRVRKPVAKKDKEGKKRVSWLF